ncbi:MAG: hypothetical protein A2X30_03120 [Elusimicrobia bacterium GWB2_63_16]|nr:MAG: hypothetical protein A2X30_03120 [Elusimicrobia bacterium GWB2_63_16]
MVKSQPSFDRAAYLGGYNRRLDLFDITKRDRWPKPPMVRTSEIILGDTCNARCVFCCAHEKMGDWLPRARAFEMMARARAGRMSMIVFSGGEPTICPYILPLTARARETGFRIIEVMTNGIRFADAAFSRDMAAAGLTMAKVAVHAAYPETHDALTGVKGSFAAALKGINNLNALGVYTSTNMAVNRRNYRQLPAYTDFFVRELGLTGFCFFFGFYSGKFSEAVSLQLSYTELMPYLQVALGLIRKHRLRIDWRFLGNFVPCLLPSCANVMIDWGADHKNRNNAVLTREASKKVSNIYDDRKTQVPACRTCVYADRCYGVDRLYLERYGDGEFRPLKKEAPQLFQPVYW